MKYIGFNPWDYDGPGGSYITNFLKNITENVYDKIIFFHQNEFHYWSFEEFDKVLDIAKLKNQKIQVITGAYRYLITPPRFTEIDIHYWKDQWFAKTYHLTYNKIKKIDNIDDLEYKYHFISMNYKTHYNRCLLMDYVAKYNLHEKNPISWHLPDSSKYYNWQYWSPKKLILDENYAKTKDHSLLPTQYYESFAQLVSETMAEEVVIISEKTVTPIIVGKPFLVAATPLFHHALKQLKFELYTEIFDYSFDLIDNMHDRFDALLQNFINLSKIPVEELKYLNKKIKDKVEYNKRRAEEIAFDFSNYPALAREVVQIYNNTGEVVDRFHLQVEMDLRNIFAAKNNVS